MKKNLTTKNTKDTKGKRECQRASLRTPSFIRSEGFNTQEPAHQFAGELTRIKKFNHGGKKKMSY
jgi:hypothetical protein